MTEIAARATAEPVTTDGRATHSAPGVWFCLATVLAIVAALDASSRFSYGMFLVAALAWVALAAAWLVRFIGSAWAKRLRFSAGEWARWLGVPIALGIVYVATLFGVPPHVRFALSQGAMDEAAGDIAGGGTLERGWIGLYPVERVEPTFDGIRFIIGGPFGSGFLDPIGFASSAFGEPPNLGGEDIYEHYDGAWWLWQESW